MALAIKTTLWMGLKLKLVDQLLAGKDVRHKKKPRLHGASGGV